MEEKINGLLRDSFFCQDIEPEDNLREDLGIDSLSMVEFIVELEDTFGIEIDESDLDPHALQTVKQIYSLIGKYVED